MRPEDVNMCAGYGTDILGFVVEFPRPVPWNITRTAARELIAAVNGPAQTCVVTSGPPEQVLPIARATKPDYLQLHGNETVAATACLVSELGRAGIKIIKTVFPTTPDLVKTAADYCATGIYALLLDPRTPDNAVHGGAADLSIFSRLQQAVNCPLILAGGITPDNVAKLVRQAKPQIIDLMTGVEHCPGVKDDAKVRALFKALAP